MKYQTAHAFCEMNEIMMRLYRGWQKFKKPQLEEEKLLYAKGQSEEVLGWDPATVFGEFHMDKHKKDICTFVYLVQRQWKWYENELSVFNHWIL